MFDTAPSSGLSGLRILLVEDNFLIAAYLKRLLVAWGAEVIGPAPSVEEGHQLAEREALNGAILDINIIGGNSVAIAQRLEARDTPYFFITGYGSPQGIPETMKRRTRLKKPIDEAALQAVIRNEFVRN
jgi:DNA-binding NarL/FixJ family response regulator